jgi:hypothetical protein
MPRNKEMHSAPCVPLSWRLPCRQVVPVATRWVRGCFARATFGRQSVQKTPSQFDCVLWPGWPCIVDSAWVGKLPAGSLGYTPVVQLQRMQLHIEVHMGSFMPSMSPRMLLNAHRWVPRRGPGFYSRGRGRSWHHVIRCSCCNICCNKRHGM